MATDKKSKRYTAEERKAYYMGVGACIGNRKAIAETLKQMPPHVKNSFHNGFDDQLKRKFKNNKKGRKGK